MTLGLIPLVILMWGVTYPARAVPMLAPGIDRLPPWAVSYLRLAGPAALAALAAVNCLLTTGTPPRLALDVPIAVGVCAVIVWRSHQLFLGVGAAVVLLAVVRAMGVA